MLNGLDPIIIFNLKQKIDVTELTNDQFQSLPIASLDTGYVDLPPIPIYLSETLTGLYIDSEDKNIDIETSVETMPNGQDPEVRQKGINSTITINMVANKESIGLTLLSAMIDLLFAKVTSREYSIDYLHGAITVFGGLIHTFSISQTADNELFTIKFELTHGFKSIEKAPIPVVSAGGLTL